MSKNLYVGNLSYNCTADDLRELFGQHGTVSSAQVVSDRETGRSRGFGFVEMSGDDAEEAIGALNGTEFRGQTLTVNEVHARESSGGSPRGGTRYDGGTGIHGGLGGYQSPSGGSAPDSPSTIDSIIVELTVSRDFESFADTDVEELLDEIKQCLHAQQNIKFLGKFRGSTKLRIELTIKQAEQLLWLQLRGVLDELQVTDAKLIGDSAAKAIVETKAASQHYDVFMCHNSDDKSEVKRIGLRLLSSGIRPWLDEWELQPGMPWQTALELQIDNICSAAVFVGNGSIGPWQHMELNAFLRQFVTRACPVIPVILRSCSDAPALPPFLNGMTWIDFKKRIPSPYDQLIWGITGKKQTR